MKKNLNKLKSFLFSSFILSSFMSFSMEESEKKDIVFKGIVNLTDKRMYLYFGKSHLYSLLDLAVDPKEVILTDFSVPQDLKGNYEQFSVGNPEHAHPKKEKQRLSGKYDQFMIVIHDPETCEYEEIPVSNNPDIYIKS